MLWAIPKIVHMQSMLDEVEVERDGRVTALDFGLPPKLHVRHETAACLDHWHGLLQIQDGVGLRPDLGEVLIVA